MISLQPKTFLSLLWIRDAFIGIISFKVFTSTNINHVGQNKHFKMKANMKEWYTNRNALPETETLSAFSTEWILS